MEKIKGLTQTKCEQALFCVCCPERVHLDAVKTSICTPCLTPGTGKDFKEAMQNGDVDALNKKLADKNEHGIPTANLDEKDSIFECTPTYMCNGTRQLFTEDGFNQQAMCLNGASGIGCLKCGKDDFMVLGSRGGVKGTARLDK